MGSLGDWTPTEEKSLTLTISRDFLAWNAERKKAWVLEAEYPRIGEQLEKRIYIWDGNMGRKGKRKGNRRNVWGDNGCKIFKMNDRE